MAHRIIVRSEDPQMILQLRRINRQMIGPSLIISPGPNRVLEIDSNGLVVTTRPLTTLDEFVTYYQQVAKNNLLSANTEATFSQYASRC